MPSVTAPVSINGSHGEGGGALFRTAIALAALTQQSVRVHSIRGATRRPGLSSEDLTFVKALEESCQAAIEGDSIKSDALTFSPKRPARPIRMSLDVQDFEKGNVPGNALIIAESLLPVLARAGGVSRVVIQGETYNPSTLTYDIFEQATLPLHRVQGVVAEPQLDRGGFGYAGMGEVAVDIEPSASHGFDWTSRGELQEIKVFVTSADMPKGLDKRGGEHAKLLLKNAKLQCEVELREIQANGPGVFVSIIARYERGIGTGSAIGARGVRIEHVVQNAFDQFQEWHRTNATVDPYLADQILLPAALASSPTAFSTSCVTKRLITMAWVIKQFFPIHITVLGRETEPGTVKINPTIGG